MIFYEEYSGKEKLEKIRNYFSPILNYFKMKEDFNCTPEYKKEKIAELIVEEEKMARKSIDKIIKILNKNKS